MLRVNLLRAPLSRIGTRALTFKIPVNAMKPTYALRRKDRVAFSTETTKVETAETVDSKLEDEINLEEGVDHESFIDVGTENKKGDGVKHTFQAETRKILDIVANSLYTDKEVFLREIVSNASDALEKARYLQNKDQGLLLDQEQPLQIKIYVNEKNNTLTIQDTGIGMTKDELILNLGTIARSGSKAFVEASKNTPGEEALSIIGQFGVGFYSVFMVSDKVEVYSLSATKEGGNQAHYWLSNGTGEYELSEADGVARGTKIIIHLKDSAKNFAIKHVVEGIIKKYSNFVGFPIMLNDAKVNTVAALWTLAKDAVTEEQHLEFYRYLANAYDTPFFNYHFRTDAPLDIKALFYFPERHMEKYGMGRSEPGVSLYCRKVLIQPKSKSILPEWLRFVKGVVDSEDLPLNISRENMQDSALLTKMNSVLTKKLIKFLADISKSNPEKYLKFWAEFGNFIREGVCSDFNHKGEIAQLLRYDTSLGEKTESSLDDYVARMPIDQKDIFYLCAPNRQFALNSPYFEQFNQEGIEVLFLYSHIDDFVMKNLEKYNKRKLVSIEAANLTAKTPEAKSDKPEDAKAKEEASKNADTLVAFFQEALKDKVQSVKSTDRLSSSPAIVVDHESSAVRKMMKYVDASGSHDLPKQKLEINTKHPVILRLLTMKDSNPELAKLIAEQVFDNALISADILDNPRTMLARLNKILEHTTKS